MKKRIITTILLVSLILTFFCTTVYAAPPSTTKFTTGLASDMGYFLQVYDGGWTDIKTPKHWGTESATVALCLDHTKDGPSSTQNYVRFSATSLYSQSTINGLYAILENGYPYGDYIYQMSGNEIKTATANAIRIWMRESEGIGYSYMTTGNIRAKSGYSHVYNAMVDLVNKARSAGSSPLSWSGQYVTTTPSVVELEPNAGGTALTATFTVNNPASSLAIDTSKLPNGVSITGSGSTWTITALLGTSDMTISDVFEGQSNRSIYNIYFYKPSYGSVYQPLIVWDYDTDRTVIHGDLTIKGQDGGYVRVIKSGETTAEKLQGAVFGVYTMDDTKVATLTTNSSGQAVSFMLPSGNYYVKETKAPTGYVLDSTKHNVTVGTTLQTHTVTLNNTKIRGKAELIKLDKLDSSLLEGVVFGLYDSNDNLIEQIMTDANGRAISSLLEYGDYYFKEITAPAKYVLDGTKHAFSITEQDKMLTLNILNDPIRGRVQIIKVGETDNPLEGIVFGLYDTGDTLIEELTTDADGLATSSLLRYGDYYVREISTLENYILDNTKHTFEIRNHQEIVDLNIQNELIRGKVKVTKTDETTKPLQGVVFEIYNTSDALVEEIITDADGIAISNDLIYCDYYLKEKSTLPPYNILTDTIPFEIRIDEAIVEFDVKNIFKRGNFKIIKVSEDNEPIAGVVFELYDSNDALIETLTTDENGEITSSILIYGDYYLKEISTLPQFNLLADTIPIQIREDGTTITIDVENEYIRGSIKVIKTNLQNGDPIEGVIFRLLNYDGERMEILTTDANGEATTGELFYGKYYLQEKSVPVGFVLDDKLQELNITKDGVIEKEIKNQPIVGSVEVYFRHVDHKHELARAHYYTDWVGEPYMTWVNGYSLDKMPIDGYSYVKADYPIEPQLIDGKLQITYWYDEKLSGTWNDVVIPKTGEHYPYVTYAFGLILSFIGMIIFGHYLNKYKN